MNRVWKDDFSLAITFLCVSIALVIVGVEFAAGAFFAMAVFRINTLFEKRKASECSEN